MTSDAETGDVIATFKITGHGVHQMRGPVTIGRNPRAGEGATVEVSGDLLISKSHLCIDIDHGELIITDLGSSNGTYLHNTEGETAVPSDRWIPVPAGAEIEFGDQRMTIERVVSVSTPDPEVHPDDAPTVERTAPAAQPAAPISRSFWAADSEAAEHVGDPTPTAAPAPSVPPASAPVARAAADDIECAQCQHDLPPGSKFCDGCGAPVIPDTRAMPVAARAGQTAVIPPSGFAPANSRTAPPPAQYGAPAPQYGGSSPQGPPPGQYGQSPPQQAVPGGAPQHGGGLVFVDPTAATSSKGGAGKKVVLGVGTLVALCVIGFGLVTLLGLRG